MVLMVVAPNNTVADATRAKTWRNSETRRSETNAYQSAVGMLSSDGCTQSNGLEEVQELRMRMAWCERRVRCWERKSWCASTCREERGLGRDWRATSKKWALDQNLSAL
ncbi:hypothetical protein GQ44DRAFT_706927 [Phaeosphaeriaceae sp. PMI808]|nr:hypothetical protein GQ44DRAFT_706927 [Phaeosphaeriaceae sp. PMI808]